MPAVKNLNDLFIHELSDIYSAEKQITRALPKMARAATSPKLVAAFEAHLEETRGQIERIDQLVEVTEGVRIKRMKCHALEGLAEEAQEIIESVEAGEVRDAGLIGAAQKVEHYEIASYGTLKTLALKLGYKEAAKLLDETLQEEKATDSKLTVIAEGGK
ncbi:ferritin-like domain-containing protein [Superficieibacter sp.]|uniref:YciE/YciF ferroxidase family protein n=1 Tax=Superficieibacter sp. TaxID=2303322 RepID=UPI0028A8A3F6|nr:ferritin-like domain-containing protein [Superficieibacter sp.]